MNHREQRSLANEKRKMREAIQAKRMQIPHAAMLSASQSVARQFADHPILAFAKSFAGYRAMRGELDIMEIFRIMARYDKQTALPCVTPEKSLIYRAWRLNDPLTRHALGMEEPLTDAPEIIPEIILVPLMAFDGGKLCGRNSHCSLPSKEGASFWSKTWSPPVSTSIWWPLKSRRVSPLTPKPPDALSTLTTIASSPCSARSWGMKRFTASRPLRPTTSPQKRSFILGFRFQVSGFRQC
jgi:hypothetical protein